MQGFLSVSSKIALNYYSDYRLSTQFVSGTVVQWLSCLCLVSARDRLQQLPRPCSEEDKLMYELYLSNHVFCLRLCALSQHVCVISLLLSTSDPPGYIIMINIQLQFFELQYTSSEIWLDSNPEWCMRTSFQLVQSCLGGPEVLMNAAVNVSKHKMQIGWFVLLNPHILYI